MGRDSRNVKTSQTKRDEETAFTLTGFCFCYTLRVARNGYNRLLLICFKIDITDCLAWLYKMAANMAASMAAALCGTVELSDAFGVYFWLANLKPHCRVSL